MNMMIQDAPQRSFNFLVNQQTRIEAAVYRIQYRDIQYPNLMTVDRTGPLWISGVTYYSADGVGKAAWFHGKSHDVPLADVAREKFETPVHTAAIGYEYDLEELGKAQLLQINLTTDKASAARRAAEEMIDRVAIAGDTSKGITGLVNNAAVTAGSAAATGSGSTTTWSTKTPDNVLADVNGALSGIYTGTLGVEMADTLLLPYTQLLDISTRRIDATNQTTILEWIERNNIYTRTTGQPLTIRGVWGLETAGSGSTARMVAYRNSEEVVKLLLPMPFQFWPAYQDGPMLFKVPGTFRVGGVDVRRPKSMRYVDGI